MQSRYRCILISVLFIACGGQCGRPSTAPEAPEADRAKKVSDASGSPASEPGGEEEEADASTSTDPGVKDVEPTLTVETQDASPAMEPDAAEEQEPFDEEAALAALDFKKVPKIPKFKPSTAQEVADPLELEYLTDHEKTCKILAEGEWASVKGQKTLVPMKRVRINDGISYRFRILIESETGEVITGFFKPRQGNYWDWLKEHHAYNVGRLINAPTVPLVMRYMPRHKFSYFIGKLPIAEQENFKWEGAKHDKLRGAFKYWVPSYRHRTFGSRVIGETYMTEIASSLHPANKKKLREEYDLYLQLGRGIVFDYLIINEDRPENLGTILMPDGTYHMVLIDNGLALGVEHKGRTVMKNMFLKMRIFPRDMIDGIRALEKDQIEQMFRPEDDPVFWLPEVIAEQFWKRRQVILDRVDRYHQMYGDVIWF